MLINVLLCLGRRSRRVSDVRDVAAGSSLMVNKRIQTVVAGSSASRNTAVDTTHHQQQQQQQTSTDKSLAYATSSRHVTDKTMTHLYG